MTQPCKICRGTGHVECPNQLCAHWCSCTVCNGTGKVEVYEDWEKGFGEERVKPEGVTVLMGCYLCGKSYPIQEMRRFPGGFSDTRGGNRVCEDCSQQYIEKWPKKEKAR